mmetsp:Transcript_78164/g.224423  ORF Transcript_78164/g.224423 Transcript_78164/m.224423 type:complete len:101 (-) Transcript_78164:112-414(-)
MSLSSPSASPSSSSTSPDAAPPAPVSILSLPEEWVFEARLVEVKSHNDRLSEKQDAWLALFCANGVDARVFKVTDNPQSKGKRKSRPVAADTEAGEWGDY